MNAAAESAVYVFGIAAGGATLPAADLLAMPSGGPTRGILAAGLQAVVCDVDVTAYRRLEAPETDDLEFLARAARTHDALLRTLAESAPVLPLRLGTLLPDDDAVLDLLDRHHGSLRAELGRLRGYGEWSVRVHDVETLVAAEPAPSPVSSPVSSGADYLRARRSDLSERQQRWRDRDALATAIHGALGELAVDAQRLSSRVADDGRTPTLHGVYLVADRDRDRLAAAVERVRTDHGVEIEMTGPWPAYHFTAVALDGVRSGSP